MDMTQRSEGSPEFAKSAPGMSYPCAPHTYIARDVDVEVEDAAVRASPAE